MTQGERLASVETKLGELEKKFDRMEDKLDELLALRYKGAGAFWLASALIGTGIVGAVIQLFSFMRGH